MTYENAPATKMLATHCAVCNRPLLDSVRVEVGMGPDCRRDHGYNIEVSEEKRAEANRLIHAVAANRNGEVAHTVTCLRLLGFVQLADTIQTRVAVVHISEYNGRLHVKAPYSESATAGWRNVPGRRWNPSTKENMVPVGSKRALYRFLQEHFAGRFAEGPKGLFQIGYPEENTPLFSQDDEFAAEARCS